MARIRQLRPLTILSPSLVLAVAGLMGCTGAGKGSSQSNATAAPASVGKGGLTLEDINVRLLRDSLGTVVTVDATLAKSKFQDAHMAQLADFAGLKSLLLSGTAVTDDGLSSLHRFKLLEDLTLDDTTITNKSINHIVRCGKLRELSLTQTHVADKGAMKLAALQGLRSLVLYGSRTTRANMEKLRKLMPRTVIWD